MGWVERTLLIILSVHERSRSLQSYFPIVRYFKLLILKLLMTHGQLVRARGCFLLQLKPRLDRIFFVMLRKPPTGTLSPLLVTRSVVMHLEWASHVSTFNKIPDHLAGHPRKIPDKKMPVDLLRPANVLKCQPEFKTVSSLPLSAWKKTPPGTSSPSCWGASLWTESCFVLIVFVPVLKIIGIRTRHLDQLQTRSKSLWLENYCWYLKIN